MRGAPACSQRSFAVCRLPPDAPAPERFWSLTRTDDELSVICAEDAVPDGAAVQRGWRGLQVAGPLDFALTGVAAALTAPLAEAQVSVLRSPPTTRTTCSCARRRSARAVAALEAAGHTSRHRLVTSHALIRHAAAPSVAPVMSDDPRHSLGRRGEELAAEHLERLGYRVVARNYRTRFGELDLVGDGRLRARVLRGQDAPRRLGRAVGQPRRGEAPPGPEHGRGLAQPRPTTGRAPRSCGSTRSGSSSTARGALVSLDHLEGAF